MPAIVDRLSKYSWPIEITFNKHKFRRLQDITDYLPKLTNLIEVNKSQFEEKELQNRHSLTEWMRLSTLTGLEVLQLEPHKDMPDELLERLPRISHARYSRSDEAERPRKLGIIKRLTNLNSLDISFAQNTARTWPLAFLQHPEKLTYLSMNYGGNTLIENSHQIWSTLTNLKELSQCVNRDIEDLGLDLRPLTALESYFVISRTVPSFSHNTNLTKLHLACDDWPSTFALLFKKLTKLKELHIRVDLTRAGQFKKVAELVSIRIIALSNVGDMDISCLSKLTQLEELKVERFTQELDLEFLAPISTLTSLALNSRVPHIPAPIVSQLTQLKELSAYRLMSEVDVVALTNLKTLKWAGNASINSIRYLTNLEHFECQSDNILYDILTDLTKLTYLEWNNSVSPDAKYDVYWNVVKELTNLQYLCVERIDKEKRLLNLVSFNNLTHLVARRTDCDFGGFHLTALKSLKAVNIPNVEDFVLKELHTWPYFYQDGKINDRM